MPDVNACPTRDDLRRFLLGQVEDEEAARVQDHLMTCQLCLDIMAELHAEDTLTSAMRAQVRLGAIPDARAVEALMDGLRGPQHSRQAPTQDATRDYCPGSTSDFSASVANGETALRSDRRRGRFWIVRPHAQGGLGQVSIARDDKLGRHVALKEIREDRAADPVLRQRFITEAEITGQLEHPGIVPIYALDEDSEGRPFYAMRFIQGRTLADAIREHHAQLFPVDLRALLQRFITVCQTIAYAHSKGVIHRDLKPANIMLGDYGETLVVDWGLAKVVSRPDKQGVADCSPDDETKRVIASGSAQTRMGSVFGTPAYMSPEQAGGRLDDLGPAADIYSLGATLYAILTGQAPFDGDDQNAVLRQVELGSFQRPREKKPTTPQPLEAICLKAMSHRQYNRYGSALKLAHDIEHWLADEPVSVCPDPWSVRVARVIRRHPLMTTGTAAGMFGAILSLALVFSIRIAGEMKRLEDVMSVRPPSGEPPALLEDVTRLVFAAGAATETGAIGEKGRAFKRAIDVQERLVAARPDLPQLEFDLAEYYEHAARFFSRTSAPRVALDMYGKAVVLRIRLTQAFPEVPSLSESLAATYGDMAWLLATYPDAEFRDGPKAVESARHAREFRSPDDPKYLDTLAAAYARAGDFPEAIAHGEKALALAPAGSRKALSQRLELYKDNKSYAESESIFPSKAHR